MKEKYYINGFREAKSYFLGLINPITESEKSALQNGEIVKRGENKFWIEKRCEL